MRSPSRPLFDAAIVRVAVAVGLYVPSATQTWSPAPAAARASCRPPGPW